jgi:hypothetical protein
MQKFKTRRPATDPNSDAIGSDFGDNKSGMSISARSGPICRSGGRSANRKAARPTSRTTSRTRPTPISICPTCRSQGRPKWRRCRDQWWYVRENLKLPQHGARAGERWNPTNCCTIDVRRVSTQVIDRLIHLCLLAMTGRSRWQVSSRYRRFEIELEQAQQDRDQIAKVEPGEIYGQLFRLLGLPPPEVFAVSYMHFRSPLHHSTPPTNRRAPVPNVSKTFISTILGCAWNAARGDPFGARSSSPLAGYGGHYGC